MHAPLPANENERLKNLGEYEILDTLPEAAYDDLTALAASLCDTPMAVISLLDESRQWFKSRRGVAASETPRDVAFCAHALGGNELLVVPDAQKDPRFADNPSVVGDPFIRFYAGAPLVTPEGSVLGTICVMDRIPRQLTEVQAQALRVLSNNVMAQMQLRRQVRSQRLLTAELEDQRTRLLEAQAVAKVGSWETDLATLNVKWSDETYRIFETTPSSGALTHQAFLQLVHPDDREAVDQAFLRSHGVRDVCSIEHRLLLANGKIKFVEERWRSYFDDAGKPTRAIGTCRDITERKQSEAERDRLFTLSLDMLCIAGFDGRLQQVSPAWTQTLGWTAEELTSKPSVEFVHPDDREATLATRSRIIKGESVIGFENRYLRKDGTFRWFSWNVHPVPASQQVFGVARDVTDRLRAEEQLRLLNTCVTHLTDIVLITEALPLDEPGPRILYVNDAFVRITGYAREEAIGRSPRFLQGPKTERAALDRIRAALQDRRPIREELINYTKSGREYWVEMDIVPVSDPQGRVTHAVAIERDVTARKQAEQALRASEERFRLLSKASNDAVWDWDIEQDKLWWNDGYIKLFGYHLDSLETTVKLWSDLLHPEDQARVLAKLHRVLEEGTEGWSDEYRFQCADGSYAHVSDRGHVIRRSDGKPVRMIGGMTDVSERKRAELDALNASVSLAGVVSALQEISTVNLPLGEVMDLLAKRAQELTGAGGSVVGLVEGGEIIFHAACGLGMKKTTMSPRVYSGLADLAVRQGAAMFCEDSETDDRVDRAACRAIGVRSIIVAPLRESSRVIGVLEVISERPHAFRQRDVSNVQILAESLGLAIQRYHTTERLRASELQYRLLFADNPQPMWVFDYASLRFVAVNRAAIEHYGYLEAEFLGMTILDIRTREDAEALRKEIAQNPAGGKRNYPVRHRKKDGAFIDVEVTSDSILFDGRPARLVLANDITERMRAEREAARANRALKMLSRCNEALIRAESEDSLLKDICEIAVEVGGFRMVWVGYAEDDPARTIAVRAHAGFDDGYLADLQLSWAPESPLAQGPAGRTIRAGRAILVKDFAEDETFQPWREKAALRGYKGVLCLPLKDGARTFGLLALYLAEVREVPADELDLLQELADDLAFGILNLRARMERRRTYQAVLAMSRGVSASTGKEFFEKLTMSLVEALGADAGLIAQLNGGVQGTCRTVAAVVAGRPVANFDCSFAASPCERLAQEDVCVVTHGAARHFPQLSGLGADGMEACVCAKITDAKGHFTGIILVAFRLPLAQQEFVVSSVKIFAARASAEMERQLAEAMTREQAALLDKAQDAILVCDLEYRITYWNKSAERLYGWSSAEILGRSARNLITIEADQFDLAIEELHAKGEWVGDLAQATKDGRRIEVEGHWTLVADDLGKPKSLLFINTNITERKKLEQQFLRAQRMESLGTLAGGIAHDLNNLLAPIMMGVDLLKQFSDKEESLHVLANIERSTRRGTDLVKQVLSFARGVEGARVAVSIGHVVREVEAIAHSTFPKNITFAADVAADLWLTTGDPTQLNQVLLNLCVNARDAMPGGGRLSVVARNTTIDAQYAAMNRGVAAGRYIRMEVADTGHGMPKDVVDRIFEPFFTTKEQGKGTGLGLSTVLGIVRSHGGFVNVYSEVGNGSTFKVYLPARDRAAPATDNVGAARVELPRGNGELILVVDDEASIRDITRQTLEAFGYRVVTAEDGAKAIGVYALQRKEIAVVLTDMMMPVLDGTALIAALQSLEPTVRIIAASGLNLNSGVARAAGLGVTHFLAKPYSADAMLTLIKKVLTQPGAPLPPSP